MFWGLIKEIRKDDYYRKDDDTIPEQQIVIEEEPRCDDGFENDDYLRVVPEHYLGKTHEEASLNIYYVAIRINKPIDVEALTANILFAAKKGTTIKTYAKNAPLIQEYKRTVAATFQAALQLENDGKISLGQLNGDVGIKDVLR